MKNSIFCLIIIALTTACGGNLVQPEIGNSESTIKVKMSIASNIDNEDESNVEEGARYKLGANAKDVVKMHLSANWQNGNAAPQACNKGVVYWECTLDSVPYGEVEIVVEASDVDDIVIFESINTIAVDTAEVTIAANLLPVNLDIATRAATVLSAEFAGTSVVMGEPLGLTVVIAGAADSVVDLIFSGANGSEWWFEGVKNRRIVATLDSTGRVTLPMVFSPSMVAYNGVLTPYTEIIQISVKDETQSLATRFRFTIPVTAPVIVSKATVADTVNLPPFVHTVNFIQNADSSWHFVMELIDEENSDVKVSWNVNGTIYAGVAIFAWEDVDGIRLQAHEWSVGEPVSGSILILTLTDVKGAYTTYEIPWGE